jgi:hypothetical protein
MQRTVERILKANPEPPYAPIDVLSECIHACVEAALSCTGCADACLGEHAPESLNHCIRLDLDTAEVCAMTARVLGRQQAPDLALVAMILELCVASCQACGLECSRHAATMSHCQICAAACHRCADACRAMIAATAEASRMHH